MSVHVRACEWGKAIRENMDIKVCFFILCRVKTVTDQKGTDEVQP